MTVAELVSMTEPELLKVRSFGRTSLREVKRKLTDMGLELGMDIPEEAQAEMEVDAD
jgi:DNA-directed RNA polymerase subunit alpha